MSSRLWNPGDGAVTEPSRWPSPERRVGGGTDLLERNGEPIPASADRFDLPVKPRGFATARIRLDDRP